MEGGDGVVAVVRGCPYNRLSVTLVPDAYFTYNGRKYVDVDAKKVQSSVGTNTERMLQNVCQYNVNYKITNYLQPSATYAFPLPLSSCHMDPFAESLRKYPLGTSSSDFIQKIIKHTQLRKKRRRWKCFRDITKPVSEQTNKQKIEQALNTTQEECDNTYSILDHSLASIEKRCSSQRELINYTYDYLKSKSLVPSVDVRYLTEIKKTIRNGLKNIIDKKPMHCPAVKKRYIHHKRHGRCLKTSSNSLQQKLQHSASSNIFKTHSRHKPCFCQPPNSDYPSYDDPIDKTLTNSNPESDHRKQKDFQQALKQSMFETKAPGDFSNHDNNIEIENICNEICEWRKNIPVSPNFDERYHLKQEAVLRKLAGTIQYLLSKHDFVSKAKPEVVRCLNALPILLPSGSNGAIFIDDLFKKLIKRFTDLTERNFIEIITKYIKKLPFEDKLSKDVIYVTNLIGKFIKELKPITLKRPTIDQIFKELLRIKIFDLIHGLDLKADKAENDTILMLVDNFADDLSHIHLYESESSEMLGFKEHIDIIERKISEWCRHLPEFKNIDHHQCTDLIRFMANKLYIFKSQDDKNQKEMLEHIEKWLTSIANKLQITFNPKRRSDLGKDLLMQILELNDEDNKIKVENNDEDMSLNTIIDWLSAVPGLPEYSIEENKETIKTLTRWLKEVKMSDRNLENKLSDLKVIISNWLQNFLKKNNIQVDLALQDSMVKRIITKLENIDKIKTVTQKPRKRWDNKPFNQTTITEIKLIIDTCADAFQIEIDESIKYKLAEQIVKDTANGRTTWEEISKNIGLILMNKTRLKKNNIKKFTNEIIGKVKKIFYPFTHAFKTSSPKTVLENLKTSQSKSENQKEYVYAIELRSKSTQTMMFEDKKDVGQSFTNKHKFVEGNLENFNSNLFLLGNGTNGKGSRSSFDFTESKNKREFSTCRSREFSFIPLNESSELNKNTEDKITTKTAEGDYHDNSSIPININAISEKILDKQFGNEKLKKVDNNTGIIRNSDNANDKIPANACDENIVFNENFTTSTPLDSPSKGSTTTKLTSVNMLDKIEISNQTELGKTCRNLLENSVYDWLISLDTNVNDLEKRYIARNIVSDFLDRKIYLELSGKESSENNEIEQLKYQIYRRLKNFEICDMLPKAIAKADDLYQYLNKLYKISKSISNVKLDLLNADSFTEMKDIIKKWLSLLPSKLYMSNNSKHESLIQNLVKEIRKLKLNNNSDALIKNEISKWLSKILKFDDKNELNVLTESLKFDLDTEKIKSPEMPILVQDNSQMSVKTDIPTEDTSEFVVENFKGTLLEWLRIIRPFPRRVMANLSLLEDFTTALAVDIKKMFENSSNIETIEFENLLMQEVIKHLKNFMGDQEKDTFYEDLGKSFVTYLKQTRLFHDISDRIPINTIIKDKSKYENEIREAVMIWSSKLTLQTQKDLKDIDQMLNNFIDILSTYIVRDVSSIEHRLRDDTLKLLRIIPLKIHEVRNDEMQELIKLLVDIMRENIISKESIHVNDSICKENTANLEENPNLLSYGTTSNMDNIYSIIENWCYNLPLFTENLGDDKENLKELRQNIASQIISMLKELNERNDISKIKFFELFRDGILKLFRNIPMTQDLEKCLNLLLDVIIEKLKDLILCSNHKDSVASTYKVLLHETINKTLSLIDNPTTDDEISFNLLKEKLADAFIDLYRPINELDIRNQFKNKLCEEIDKFCKDYLKQNLIIPKNCEKVKEDLDKALKNVSLPKSEDQELNDSFPVNDITNRTLKVDTSTQCSLNIPPTTLDVHELEHLAQIRVRSNIRANNQNTLKKDVSTSPKPVDIAIQTDVKSMEKTTQTINNIIPVKSSSFKEVSPQVIIKKFYWDSSGSQRSIHLLANSEISQRIEPQPPYASILFSSPLDKRESPKNKEINSKQWSKTIQTHEYEIETGNPENQNNSNIPKNTVNSYQQTSQEDPKHLDNDARGVEYVQDNVAANRNYETKEVETEPIPSMPFCQDEQNSREVNETERAHSGNTRREDNYENLAKVIPEDKQINDLDLQQYNKEGKRCYCKNHILSKCKNRITSRQPNLKHCARGFGCFCPHPSNFFFKKDY